MLGDLSLVRASPIHLTRNLSTTRREYTHDNYSSTISAPNCSEASSAASERFDTFFLRRRQASSASASTNTAAVCVLCSWMVREACVWTTFVLQADEIPD